jgi:hypothetical protein
MVCLHGTAGSWPRSCCAPLCASVASMPSISASILWLPAGQLQAPVHITQASAFMIHFPFSCREVPEQQQPYTWKYSRLRALLLPCLSRTPDKRPTAAALVARVTRIGHANTVMSGSSQAQWR